jgi:hypothetical protein
MNANHLTAMPRSIGSLPLVLNNSVVALRPVTLIVKKLGLKICAKRRRLSRQLTNTLLTSWFFRPHSIAPINAYDKDGEKTSA